MRVVLIPTKEASDLKVKRKRRLKNKLMIRQELTGIRNYRMIRINQVKPIRLNNRLRNRKF